MMRPHRGSTLYTGGRVHALGGESPAGEALLVRDGRVAGVGTVADMQAIAGSGAQRVDVRGATVLPGLIDTHPHLLHFGAIRHPLVDISDVTAHAEIVTRIQARAARTPPGAWIMTTPVGEAHYFIRRSYRDLAERQLPNRLVLDRATTQHPVFIQAWAPVTPNVCAFNSAALSTLGITRTTPERCGDVWIEKDQDGEPTGILRGSVNNYYTNDPFMTALLQRIPLLDPGAMLAGTPAAMAEYNHMGVTTVYEAHTMGEAEIAAYRALRADGRLSLRVLTALEAEIYGLPWSTSSSLEEFSERLERARTMSDVRDDWLRHDGVTVSQGGPCWPGFLRTHRPYRGPYGELTNGVTFVSEEKQRLALEFCATHGLRLNFLGAGDRDHDEFLANAEIVASRHPSGRTRGWILQHVFFLSSEQARRYAALGFQVTTSMSFSWGKGDMFTERLGAAVLGDLIPLRRMLDSGLVVACGTDWGPKNVFEHIALAQTHRFAGSGRHNLGAAQPVTRAEALSMWTRDAARVLAWDGIGTLHPGAHADLIIIDRDPLTCDLDALPRTRVLRTVLGGNPVYDEGAL